MYDGKAHDMTENIAENINDRAPLANPEKNTSDWVTGGEPMTGPQRSYLHTSPKKPGVKCQAT